MIVEKPEILKQWMTETMEPLCDAEPGKLAKYVLALIKKDMPPNQLRESMKNNLDIFLHDHAAPFVDRLFETLANKSYMPQASPDSTTQPAAAQAAAAVAPVPPEPARRRAEPDGGGRGRGERRPTSRPRDRDDRVERPERKRSWEERRRRSPPRDRRTRRSRSPPRVRTKSRSPPRTKSKSPAKGKAARSSRSRSPRSRSRSRSPRYNRSKSPIKFDRSPPAAAEAERAPEPAAVPDLRQKLNAAGKQRCSDYDEKGYCMRGDQCPFDHGLDPVILNDVSLPLPEALKYSQPPPSGVPAPAPAPPAPAPPHFNPLVQPPPPRPPIVEPYNPDAPSLTVAAAAPVWLPLPNYTRPPPPHVRPYYPAPAPARQLLSVQVTGPPAAPTGPTGVRPRHPFPSSDRWAGREQNEPPRKRGNFDTSRLGGGPRPRFDPANCSLELRKVPAGLNQITHLNNHFVKFGKITNIQVSFGGDPEAALVTFSNPAEAKAAYKCTEAVLNNRFIKVFWHNKERDDAAGEAANGSAAVAARAPVRARLGSAAGSVLTPAPATANRVVQVSAGGAGQLTRTVTNPEVLRQQAEQQAAAKQQSIDAIKHSQQMLAAKVTLQAKQKEKQKEVLKLAADLQKRKSELLEKQLAQQKALLAKLENKSMKPEERRTLVSTVKELQEAIVKTRAEALSAVEKEPAGRGKEATEREVLDAEMDLYQKQQAGVDTSQLQRRVTELRQQLNTLSRGRGRGRPATARGRGRGRGSLSFVPGQQRPTTVDRRPTKLNISGYELDEKSALLAHMAQYGEIVDYQSDEVTPSVVVQFRTRQEAEAALTKGRHFRDRLLTVNWHTQPAAAPAPAAPAPASAAAGPAPAAALKTPPESVEMDLLAEDEDVELESLSAAQPDDLLAGDEEEEDEQEERSWRR